MLGTKKKAKQKISTKRAKEVDREDDIEEFTTSPSEPSNELLGASTSVSGQQSNHTETPENSVKNKEGIKSCDTPLTTTASPDLETELTRDQQFIDWIKENANREARRLKDLGARVFVLPVKNTSLAHDGSKLINRVEVNSTFDFNKVSQLLVSDAVPVPTSIRKAKHNYVNVILLTPEPITENDIGGDSPMALQTPSDSVPKQSTDEPTPATQSRKKANKKAKQQPQQPGNTAVGFLIPYVYPCNSELMTRAANTVTPGAKKASKNSNTNTLQHWAIIDNNQRRTNLRIGSFKPV